MIWFIISIILFGLFVISMWISAIGGILLEKQRLNASRNRTEALQRVATELWKINNRLNSYYKSKTVEQMEPEKGEDNNEGCDGKRENFT